MDSSQNKIKRWCKVYPRPPPGGFSSQIFYDRPGKRTIELRRECNDQSFEIKGNLDQDEDNIFVLDDGKIYGIMSPCWWEEKNGLQQELHDSLRNLQQELCEKEDSLCNLQQELCEKEHSLRNLLQKLSKKKTQLRDLTQKMKNMKID